MPDTEAIQPATPDDDHQALALLHQFLVDNDMPPPTELVQLLQRRHTDLVALGEIRNMMQTMAGQVQQTSKDMEVIRPQMAEQSRKIEDLSMGHKNIENKMALGFQAVDANQKAIERRLDVLETTKSVEDRQEQRHNQMTQVWWATGVQILIMLIMLGSFIWAIASGVVVRGH